MKIGGAPLAEDVARVQAVREAVGPNVEIMVDANNAYSPLEAIRIARRIEDLDIYWFEEPVHAEDYEGLRRVHDSTAIPIATGENEYTRYGFAAGRLWRRGYPQPDANVLGGITKFRHIVRWPAPTIAGGATWLCAAARARSPPCPMADCGTRGDGGASVD